RERGNRGRMQSRAGGRPAFAAVRAPEDLGVRTGEKQRSGDVGGEGGRIAGRSELSAGVRPRCPAIAADVTTAFRGGEDVRGCARAAAGNLDDASRESGELRASPSRRRIGAPAEAPDSAGINESGSDPRSE